MNMVSRVKRRTLCALGTWALLSAAPAHAQQPPTSWEGWYAGGIVGVAWTGVDAAVDTTPSSGTFNAIVGGGVAGYNFQITDEIIAGLETDITFADLSGGFALARHKVSFVGRLGFLATPSLLIFGVAGLAGGQYNADITVTTTSVTMDFNDNEEIVTIVSTSSAQVEKDERLWGFTIGGGFETETNAFAIPVRFGAEYRYTDFQEWNFVAAGHAFAMEPKVQEIRFRLIIPIN